MEILTEEIKKRISRELLRQILLKEFSSIGITISLVIDELYANIPANKRISYGIVHTVKVLATYLHCLLVESGEPFFKTASSLFQASNDFKSKTVSLGILSFDGLEDYQRVLPYFGTAAASEDWNTREISQILFRKLIKKFPPEIKEYLLKLVKSEDPNLRRFVSETLRPVCENVWFYKNPGYSLSIIHHLFQESNSYPRTSVGNNLSDLARRLPDLVYGLVSELVAGGNKNSYWIAYRACRNLVKKEPAKVMDLLKVDEYRYKKKIYQRNQE